MTHALAVFGDAGRYVDLGAMEDVESLRPPIVAGHDAVAWLDGGGARTLVLHA